MSDGGSIVNVVRATRAGEDVKVEVVVSHDTVELGGWTFTREDLLFALAAKDDPPPDAAA
jgi:hypothetical protein